MIAALLTEFNKPLEVCELSTLPLEYGQVLVKMDVSGICGAQLQEIAGAKQGGPLPHPLGHEGCGIVLDTGIGVRNVTIDDKVVLHWRKGDGIDSDFPKYNLGGRTITGGKVTTFSSHSVCSENRLTAVPHDVPAEFCALLGCGLSTALGTIEHEAKLLMGETVLIVGCGGLGLNLILAARLRGASRISVLEPCENKRQAAMAQGATDFNSAKASYDVVIDTSGNPAALIGAMGRIAPSGRFIMVGQPRPMESVPILNARHMFDGEGKTIMATQGGRFRPSSDISRYVNAWRCGHLKFDGIVTHRVPLTDINRGIQLVRDGHAGRVLVNC